MTHARQAGHPGRHFADSGVGAATQTGTGALRCSTHHGAVVPHHAGPPELSCSQAQLSYRCCQSHRPENLLLLVTFLSWVLTPKFLMDGNRVTNQLLPEAPGGILESDLQLPVREAQQTLSSRREDTGASPSRHNTLAWGVAPLAPRYETGTVSTENSGCSHLGHMS